jgi:hypothetical protein
MKASQHLIAALCVAAFSGAASLAFANPSATPTTSQPETVIGGPPTSSAIPTVTPAAESPPEPGEDTRKVCRQRDTMGTRLRAVRVCRTIAEWRTHDNAGRQRAKTLTEQRPDGLRDPRMGGG